MKCPQCGADFQLDDSREFGFCTYCGTKIMQEKIVVEHNGSVKVDTTEELKKLYIAARNSVEAGDNISALDYYRRITMIDPNSWEAMFYSVILGLNNIKNAEIESAATRISACIPKVFQLVCDYVTEEEEKKVAVKEVVNVCYNKTLWLISASHSFKKALGKGNGTIAALGAKSVVGGLANGFGGLALSGVGTMARSAADSVNRTGEDINRCMHITNVIKTCGDNIKSFFDVTDDEYKVLMLQCWKVYLQLAIEHGQMSNREQNELSVLINSYDSDFEIIEKSSKTISEDKRNDFAKEMQDTLGEKPSFGETYKFIWKKMPKGLKYYMWFSLAVVVVVLIYAFIISPMLY